MRTPDRFTVPFASFSCCAMMSAMELPLFPLSTVLLPGGSLPLRVFEPRYLDMIKRCLREERGFGVVLIRSGSEVRGADTSTQPRTFTIGTVARIVDFNQLSDGLLGIVCCGDERFRILGTAEQADGLLLGDVQLLPEEPEGVLNATHDALVDILKELVKHPMIEKLGVQVDFDSARSVSWRLAELLPIEPEIKQSLLQMTLPRERLAELNRLVRKLRGDPL